MALELGGAEGAHQLEGDLVARTMPVAVGRGQAVSASSMLARGSMRGSGEGAAGATGAAPGSMGGCRAQRLECRYFGGVATAERLPRRFANQGYDSDDSRACRGGILNSHPISSLLLNSRSTDTYLPTASECGCGRPLYGGQILDAVFEIERRHPTFCQLSTQEQSHE